MGGLATCDGEDVPVRQKLGFQDSAISALCMMMQAPALIAWHDIPLTSLTRACYV